MKGKLQIVPGFWLQHKFNNILLQIYDKVWKIEWGTFSNCFQDVHYEFWRKIDKILHSLHYIHYNWFITLHSLHWIHYMAFITLHWLHYILEFVCTSWLQVFHPSSYLSGVYQPWSLQQNGLWRILFYFFLLVVKCVLFYSIFFCL